MDDMKNEVNKMPHITIDEEKAAEQSVQSLESLQQIQEAKPGNKRALIVDLPPYLYSIPALASFFEPYGEVAMLQILPQKKNVGCRFDRPFGRFNVQPIGQPIFVRYC